MIWEYTGDSLVALLTKYCKASKAVRIDKKVKVFSLKGNLIHFQGRELCQKFPPARSWERKQIFHGVISLGHVSISLKDQLERRIPRIGRVAYLERQPFGMKNKQTKKKLYLS